MVPKVEVRLLILLFVGVAIAASIPKEELSNPEQRFIHLGSVSAGGSGSKFSINVQSSADLFISQNAAGFATAESDCKAIFGENAGLLSIETEDELRNISRVLDTDDTISSFWIGGKYDRTRGGFTWTNRVPFGPWAPWDIGFPNSKLSITRVFGSTSSGELKFRTQYQTVSTRYICEVSSNEPEEIAEPCYSNNDLVIVIDSSGSIGADRYNIALEFAARLATVWADNPNNRVAVIVYSHIAQTIISLNQRQSVSSIRNTVYNAPYFGSITNSDAALNLALSELNDNSRNVPRNLVFLTDGISNNPTATQLAASNLQAIKIRTFSVGIGSGAGSQELLAIAGDSNRVFTTAGFHDLLKLLQPVSRKVCA